MLLAKYRKTITAAVGALIITIGIVWDLHVDQAEAVQLVVAWTTAFGVYQVPNAKS